MNKKLTAPMTTAEAKVLIDALSQYIDNGEDQHTGEMLVDVATAQRLLDAAEVVLAAQAG
jgi:hypothetical protein